jgi:oligoribonuclease NrnB/cAMP/cGMP phosphodiesterase (DHH superfamily)
MNRLVYYHNDLDGKCAGAIVAKMYPKAEYIKIDYDMPFPWEKVKPDTEVHMVDFAVKPYDDMKKLKEKCKHLIWIDHHKTALEWADEAKFEIEGVTEDGKAGCELAWNYYYPLSPMPEAVRLLGRYDVWDKKLKSQWETTILPFQYGMQSIDADPKDKIWDVLLRRDSNTKIKQIISNGSSIYRYITQINREIMDDISYDGKWEGYRCLFCNHGKFNSDLFKSKWNEKDYDLMVGYKHNGKEYTVSIYTTKDIDGSVISSKYGGGGHAQASGFVMNKLPWVKT